MEAKTSHPATIFRLLATVLVAAFLFGSLPAGRSAAEPAIEPTLSPTGTVAPAVTPPDKLYFPLVFNKYDPKSSLVIRKYPAFDTCHLPSLATMLTWWNKSPYWTFNLYLGGVAFSSGCNFSGLSEEWLDAVDGQGWTFILTWVGLQAPCMPGDHKMSADTGTAYQQGREEAGAAYARAQSLGFYGDLMLTADIESYARYQTTACREAVKSYVSGWVSQLHELGAKAAAYGSPCSSYVRDWATIPNVPDQVWIAEWIKNPYYNPSVSVYGSLCLADNLWDNHQRLRQYAGDHNETWGNATLNIDSDAVDGTVQTFRDGGLREYPTASAMMVKTLGVEMQDVQLVAPRIGWALAGGRLQWTDDDGAAWKDITPVDAPGALMGAFFANAQHGWLAAQSSSGDALHVLRTADSGLTWQDAVLPAAASGDMPAAESVGLQFVDAQTGWASVALQTGAAFSRGALYKTADGGKTWDFLPLPVGGQVHFADAQYGWLNGGPGDRQVFATIDGGATWQEIILSAGGASSTNQIAYGLPGMFGSEGLLAAVAGNGDRSQLELYTTHKLGGAWEAVQTPLPGLPESAVVAPALSAAGAGRWIAALPDEKLLVVQDQAGIYSTSILTPQGLPGGVVKLDFANSTDGWAQTWNGSCSGEKTSADFHCEESSQLFETGDGGQTWKEITP